jgi:hypothetical protein
MHFITHVMSLTFFADESMGVVNYDVTNLLQNRDRVASSNPLLRVSGGGGGGDEQGSDDDAFHANIKVNPSFLTLPSALLAIPEEYIGLFMTYFSLIEWLY